MIHIVFDLDGTLADTQKIHQQIESDFLASMWVIINPDNIGKAYAGRSPIEWIPEFLIENSIPFIHDEIIDFVESKDQKVFALLKAGKIELMPSVKETLLSLAGRWIKMGISSGSCREIIDLFIEHFQLNMIEVSTSANEVINKKPAPDVFISSFEKLEKIHGNPMEKWVVGDGKTDIIGGNAAGAKTILCYNHYNIDYNYMIKHFPEIIKIIS